MVKKQAKDEEGDFLSQLNSDECKNRVAAAESDMHKLANHVKYGSHPNLLEV